MLDIFNTWFNFQTLGTPTEETWPGITTNEIFLSGKKFYKFQMLFLMSKARIVYVIVFSHLFRSLLQEDSRITQGNILLITRQGTVVVKLCILQSPFCQSNFERREGFRFSWVYNKLLLHDFVHVYAQTNLRNGRSISDSFGFN